LGLESKHAWPRFGRRNVPAVRELEAIKIAAQRRAEHVSFSESGNGLAQARPFLQVIEIHALVFIDVVM
jgi:hypothetical protein